MEQRMLEQLKEYIKYDGEDESLVVSLYQAAAEKAETETGKRFEMQEGVPKSELYWLAVKMMVAHWYDNRGIATDKSMSDIPMSAQMLLDHIALCGAFPRLTAGGENG